MNSGRLPFRVRHNGAWLLLSIYCGVSCAAEPNAGGPSTGTSGDEVLTTLRAFDTVFLAGFSARGVMTEALPRSEVTIHLPGQEKPEKEAERTTERKAKYEMTMGPAKDVLIATFLSQFAGAGVRDKNGQTPAVLHQVVWVQTDGKFIQRRFISPDGSEKLKNSTTEIDLTSKPRPEPDLDRAVWSLGRGFGRLVDKVTDVKESGDKIVLQAPAEVALYPGRWVLEIDKRHAFLVTSAQFIAEGQTEPMTSMVGHEVATDGPVPFVRRAIYKLADVLRCDYTWEEVRNVFDEDLYQRGLTLVTEPPKPDSYVEDRTAEKKTVTWIHETKPLASPVAVAPSEKVSRLKWWLVGINVLVIIALVALIIRRRQSA